MHIFIDNKESEENKFITVYMHLFKCVFTFIKLL
jgi:hypothetical protein